MMANTTLQIVTFLLGEDLFAADIFAVERVLRWHQPTSIPNVPDWIEGVIEYQNRVVPVINLRKRFEMEAIEPSNLTRILIFNSGGEWIAATVDSVLEVTVLDAKQLSAPPPIFRGLAGEFLRGVVRRNDKLVIFLDVPRLLSTNERLSLEQATGVMAKHG